MTRRRPDTPEVPSPRDSRAALTSRELVERALLLILLSLIPLRAVLTETHTFEVPRLFRSLDAPVAAMPATTFAIIAVIVAAAGVVFALQIGGDRPGYCFTGAEGGALLLAAAMFISTMRAGQKHLALVGSLDALGLFLYLLTLRQLLNTPWRIRLALTVILATGAVIVARCAFQRWVEMPETIRYFEEHKKELLATNPSSADEPRSAGFFYDYEQRLRSGAVTGYFSHPNVLASYLLLVVVAAAGLAFARLRSPPKWACAAPAIIAIGAGVALAATQSKGAVAACAGALVIWLAALRFSTWLASRRMTALVSFWLGAVVLGLGTAHLLRARPESLGRSMLFRTMYWRGAGAMMEAQGPWGIGADNFGRFFSRYKPLDCPEDVEDPHNWMVKSAVEWGTPGVIGVLLALAGVSWQLARGLRVEAAFPAAPDPPGLVILWAAGIGAVVFGVWWLLLGEATPGYVAILLFVPAVCWVISFVALAIEGKDSRTFAKNPLALPASAIVAALIGFLIHSAIDLAFVNAGAATTFFALMAVVLSQTEALVSPSLSPSNADAGRTRRRRIRPSAVAFVIAAGSAAASCVIIVRLALPAARLGSLLQTARLNSKAASYDDYWVSPGGRAYREAIDAYSLDATALDELAEELIHRISTVSQADATIGLVKRFVTRDSDNAVADHDLATLYFQRFELGHDVVDLRRAIALLRRSIAAYPSAPVRHLTLADLLEKLSAATGSLSARREAVVELQTALDLDTRRVYVSQPNRLGEDRRKAIETRIRQLGGA